jgi:hypothetical protein
MKRPKSREGFLRMCFGQDIAPTAKIRLSPLLTSQQLTHCDATMPMDLAPVPGRP